MKKDIDRIICEYILIAEDWSGDEIKKKKYFFSNLEAIDYAKKWMAEDKRCIMSMTIYDKDYNIIDILEEETSYESMGPI